MNEYISRNGLKVVKDTMPSAEAFLSDPKLYYEVQGYERLYFHLDHMGDSIKTLGEETFDIEPVRRGDNIVVRYKEVTLTAYPDTPD